MIKPNVRDPDIWLPPELFAAYCGRASRREMFKRLDKRALRRLPDSLDACMPQWRMTAEHTARKLQVVGAFSLLLTGCVLPNVSEFSDAGSATQGRPSGESTATPGLNVRAGSDAGANALGRDQDAATAMRAAVDASATARTAGAGAQPGKSPPAMPDVEDAGEPETKPTCEATTCQPGGTCVNDDRGYYCRCRSGFSATGTTACINQRFSTTSDTAKDLQTGLVWQRNRSDVMMRASSHAEYCNSLAVAGGGWRLPTVEELDTLVDREATGGKLMIDWVTFFMRDDAHQSYSSSSLTTMANAAGQIAAVNFATGERSWFTGSFLFALARCVR